MPPATLACFLFLENAKRELVPGILPPLCPLLGAPLWIGLVVGRSVAGLSTNILPPKGLYLIALPHAPQSLSLSFYFIFFTAFITHWNYLMHGIIGILPVSP